MHSKISPLIKAPQQPACEHRQLALLIWVLVRMVRSLLPSKTFKRFKISRRRSAIKQIVTSLCLLSVCILSACSSPKIQLPQESDDNPKTKHLSNDSLQTLLDHAEKAIQDAEAQSLAFYAPTHFTQAKRHLEQAKRHLEQASQARESAPASDQLVKNEGLVRENATLVTRLITAGVKIKHDVQSYLKEAIAQKRLLQSLNAPEIDAETYEDILDHFSGLIRSIEQGEVNKALSSEEALRMKMTKFEITVLHELYTQPVVELLEQIEDLNGEHYAPVSYAQLKKELDTNTAFIETNFRDRVQIEKNSQSAYASAQKTLMTAKEVRRLMKMTSANTEQFVLELQSARRQLSDTLGVSAHNIIKADGKEQRSHHILIEETQTLLEATATKRMKEIESLNAQVEKLEKKLSVFRSLEYAGSSDTNQSRGEKYEWPLEHTSKKLESNKENRSIEQGLFQESYDLSDDEQSFDSVEQME